MSCQTNRANGLTLFSPCAWTTACCAMGAAPGGYITVSCSVLNSWVDRGVATATFTCDVTNTGPYTLSSVTVDCRALTSTNYWNIIPNSEGTCGFPSWARWGPGGGTNFGFVQQTSPTPIFPVVSYSGAPQSAAPPSPSRQPSPSPPLPSQRKSPPPSPSPRRAPSPPPPRPPVTGMYTTLHLQKGLCVALAHIELSSSACQIVC